MYIVKSTPIYSNKKLYRVGEIFPYSDKEKHLLWNLEEVTERSRSETTPNLSAKSSKAGEKVSENQETTRSLSGAEVKKTKRLLSVTEVKK
ncbi:MAG: hypothetical protein KKF62_01955 [Bacteroidetes bacterium]|nr:hypothetical protein [Bacteroidota bacterium]MBU1115328.1 hypothetical protein [Bacteroidota bacterium]MBU1799683.1 hypothetical protein [Bacteroidota bacterium]